MSEDECEGNFQFEEDPEDEEEDGRFATKLLMSR